MTEIVAAVGFAVAAVPVAAFQVALALGAPWGAYAMGGMHPGRLPTALRIAALVQATLVAGLAVVVLSDAALVAPALGEAAPWLVWVAVAFSAAAVAANAVTRSAVERRTWLPVAVVMLASSVVVAVS